MTALGQAASLLANDQSIRRFRKISAAAKAVGAYNTHAFAADVLVGSAAVRARKPGDNVGLWSARPMPTATRTSFITACSGQKPARR
jgi:hypothetical protein